MNERMIKAAPLLSWLFTGGFVFLYPAMMAFVFDDLGWRQAGWALYFFILPMVAFTLGGALIATLMAFKMDNKVVPAATGAGLIGLVHLGFALLFFTGW